MVVRDVFSFVIEPLMQCRWGTEGVFGFLIYHVVVLFYFIFIFVFHLFFKLIITFTR